MSRMGRCRLVDGGVCATKELSWGVMEMRWPILSTYVLLPIVRHMLLWWSAKVRTARQKQLAHIPVYIEGLLHDR
jgi:hypothetical protein